MNNELSKTKFYLSFVNMKFLFMFAMLLQLCFTEQSCKIAESVPGFTKTNKLLRFKMAKPSATVNIKRTNYQGISDLLARAVSDMTANVNFATPSPALVDLTTAQANIDAAIALWGPQGNRGSHAQLVALRDAASIGYNALIAEADYVTNTAGITAGNDYTLMASIIVSSGFGAKNSPTPQGPLGSPIGLFQMFQSSISIHDTKLKWTKPAGLRSPNNVKSYKIYRSLINDFSTALPIGTSTKTSFIDVAPTPSTVFYYWVLGVNTNGDGAPSMVCQVNTVAP